MKNLIWVLFICLASCKSQEPKEIKIMGLEKNLWDKYEYLDILTHYIKQMKQKSFSTTIQVTLRIYDDNRLFKVCK